MKPAELLDYLVYCIPNHFPVLITGASGIGKSDVVSKASSVLKVKLIISHPVVSDPTDFKGFPFPRKTGEAADFLPFGDLEQLIKATEEIVFFFDDLGQAPISVQAAIMQLILSRQINGHKISDKITFIAATNRKEDKAGVTGIIEPLIRRFYLAELDVNWKDWITWAAENNMPDELIAFIAWKPDMLNNPTPSKAIVNTFCPRTIAMLGVLHNTKCPDNLFNDAAIGAVGPVFAAMYIRFLELFKDLPTVDSVIDDPDQALIPPDKGAIYAFTVSLSKRMSDDNISQIIKYLYRLPAELNVCCMKMATTKMPDLQNTKAFIKWTKNMNEYIF